MKRVAAAFMAFVIVFLMVGCAADTYLYKSKAEDWSIKMPKEFAKDKEESNEQLKSFTVSFKTENESFLAINEMTDEKLEINEETLKEELTVDNYMHVEKYETLEIKGVGTAYGAVLTDESVGMGMIYYRLKYKDKAVSFILYRKGSFSEEQISKAKDMIITFKGLK